MCSETWEGLVSQHKTGASLCAIAFEASHMWIKGLDLSLAVAKTLSQGRQ